MRVRVQESERVSASVCVPLVITGIQLNSFLFSTGGLVVHASTSPMKRLALNTDIGGDAHRRTCLNFNF